jgi:hypothetical protein
LVQRGEVVGEGRLRADLLGAGALRDRAIVDAPGQLVQGRPDGTAEDVGDLGIGECSERSDGLDAQPMQLLLGDRSDPPQPAHR